MRKKIIIALALCLALLIAIAYYWSQEKDKNRHLTLYGNVDVRQVDIGFRVSGRVQKMFFEEGDLVPAGTLLGTLDKQPYLDQVREAKANIASIKASFSNAEEVYNRRNELIGTGSVSQEELGTSLANRLQLQANLEQAEASLGIALTALNDTEVLAPTEGIILTRVREPGTVVKVADPIYTLSITSPVWIRAFISEPNLGLVHFGMRAEVYTDTPGSPVYQGRVGFISPIAEFTPKTVETTELRTDLVYRLRIYVDNPGQGLKQGMPVTVKLLKDETK